MRSQRDQAKIRIKDLVLQGKLSSEGFLPSIRKTAEIVGFNRDAVWRALTELEKEGFVVSAENKRFELHPSVKKPLLRTLDIRLVTVGAGSIRFSGLQRFHKALLDNESNWGIRTHLKCVMDARDIKADWVKGMDGLILGGYFDHSELMDSVMADIPRIGVITSSEWSPDVFIDTDNRIAGELAAERLDSLGVKSVCLMSSSKKNARHLLRQLGFQAKWLECGHSMDSVSECWVDGSNSYQRVIELEKVTRDIEKYDAVFCLGKDVALDLLSILNHRGVDVPGSVRVLSVDGTFEGLKTTPNLSYVKQDFRKMAMIAAEKLRSLCSDSDISNKERPTEKILVEPNFVARDSG